MNKKISLGLALSIALIIAAIAVSATYTIAMNSFNNRMSAVIERQDLYEDLSELDSQARLSLLYAIDEQKLNESLMSGYVSGLGDPDAQYLTKEEYSKYSSHMIGTDYGIGIDISQNADGNIIVNRVHSDSPAEEKGVLKGDVITSVNDSKVLEIGYNAAAAKLAASDSSTVKFLVKRDGGNYQFTVKKDYYTVSSVEYRMISGEVGCIRITEFIDNTPAQFASALSSLKDQSISGLILDVRDNKGGSFESACKILDTLLPAGNIMLTVDADGKSTVIYKSDTNSENKIALAVLVNENTQGAAELFASAVADYHRGDVIGVSTAGLFTVQKVFPLSSGAAVKLTTSGWKTASGSVVSDGRIVPTFEVMLTDYQRENRFHLTDAEDPQIQTALERVTVLQESMDDYEYVYEISGSDASSSDISETDKKPATSSSDTVSPTEQLS